MNNNKKTGPKNTYVEPHKRSNPDGKPGAPYVPVSGYKRSSKNKRGI